MSDTRIDRSYGMGATYAQREELEKTFSTEAVANLAARRAGLEPDGMIVALTGDDATYGEVRDAAEHDGYSVAGALTIREAGSTASEIVCLSSEAAEASAFGSAVELTGIFGGAIGAGADLVLAWTNGDKENVALRQDAMHLAVMCSTEGLPEGFRAAEVSKREVAANGSFQAPYMKIATEIRNDKGMHAIVQLRCDEGMKSAKRAIDAGQSTKDFLAAQPGLAARYHADVAFRAGFDGLAWAKDHAKDAPGQYDAAVRDLAARDVRNHSVQNHVWQG